MIRVNIVEDERIIKSVTKKGNDGLLLAWAQENEKSPGHCVFTKTGEILEVVDNDEVFELLIRAALNCLDLRDAKTAFSKNELLYTELKKLGFKDSGKRVETDIKTFFKPCCNH